MWKFDWDLYFDSTPKLSSEWEDNTCGALNNDIVSYNTLKDKFIHWTFANPEEVLADQRRLQELRKCIDNTKKGLSWLKLETKEIISWNENIDNSIISISIDFIKDIEGPYIPISKWDNSQYTWWYWTKAPWKWLSISKKQAMIELQEKINSILSSLNKEKWFLGLNKNQKISLISFFYNVGLTKKWKENLMYRLRNWYLKAATNMMLEYKYAGWKHNEWLLSRRKKEVNKFWS